MSLAPLSAPERKQSLNISLGSNNPFRNRAVSPSSPASPGPNGRPERPRSTNPFLDDTELFSPQSAPEGTRSSMGNDHPFTGNTAELFENLSLDPKPKERRPAPPRPDKPYHARERSEPKEKDPFDIFADPPDTKGRSSSRPREGRPRPRRNSESSVMEKPKLLDLEDEKRRRERRHRDGDGKHRDGKHRSRRSPNYKLDVIDKLDVTSIYGTGLFHHDGPFDACNPHRNRKGSKTAPMQAFPKDSKNMALGGAGPNNSDIDLALFHGHTSEGYLDYSASGKSQAVAFDPTARVEPIHGAESMGLGTSTFLEGTPASRAAIERRQSENEEAQNGLQRKKSLAQKIRGINRTASARVVSPEPVRSSPGSSGLPSSSYKSNERNPFFQDYDEAYDKKGAKIEEAGRSRASSSPKRTAGLERRITDDRPSGSGGGEESRTNGGGLINRMKSLRKTRPDRRTD
ncbi:hypothetical protein VTN77DRAFT_5819 [Rasamsonia byssochlamydoides]|uniref:uncharacterized protein n=1 Tax=Rasamsonia byssochlamydoides TaxID=89139 RepID=UPI003743CF73